jgi:hypothetical protein
LKTGEFTFSELGTLALIPTVINSENPDETITYAQQFVVSNSPFGIQFGLKLLLPPSSVMKIA